MEQVLEPNLFQWNRFLLLWLLVQANFKKSLEFKTNSLFRRDDVLGKKFFSKLFFNVE